MLDFLAICCFLLILFAVLLFYLTREQSYEQALEEQRNKNDDLLTPTNIIAGDNVDKGGNRKDRTKRLNLNKKSNKESTNKQTASNKQQQQSAANKIQQKSININEKTLPGLTDGIAPSPVDESKILKQDDHRKSSENESIPTISSVAASTTTVPVSIPDDKIDAVKIDPIVEQPIKIKNQSSTSSMKTAVIQDTTTMAINKSNNHQPITNGKKSKKSNLSKSSRDFNMNDIIEIIKSFTKEEVTDLTDHLLTIQANDQSINDLSWHTKNDPVESLRKQLTEKEEMINTQKINLENSKRRFDLINNELKMSKSKLQNECRMRQEIEMQKNNFARMLSEMEKNGKQQMERLAEKNRITRQEEFSRHNIIISDMKNEINNLKIQLMEKQKMLAEMDERSKTNDVNKQNLEILQQDLLNAKMDYEKNLKNLTEKYQAEICYLNEDQLKLNDRLNEIVMENEQLTAQIETLKQSLKMAEKTAINNESSAKENLSKASATDANENSNSTDNYFKDALTELEGLKTKNKTLEEKKKLIKQISEKLHIVDEDVSIDKLFNSIDELRTFKKKWEKSDGANKEHLFKIQQLEKKLEDSKKEIITLKDENKNFMKQISEKLPIKDEDLSIDKLLKSIDDLQTAKEDFQKSEDTNKKYLCKIQKLDEDLEDSKTKIETLEEENKNFMKQISEKLPIKDEDLSIDNLLKSIGDLQTAKEDFQKSEDTNKEYLCKIQQLEKELEALEDSAANLKLTIDDGKKKEKLLKDQTKKELMEKSSKSNDEIENLKLKLDVTENESLKYKNSLEDVEKRLRKIEGELQEGQCKRTELTKNEQQITFLQKELTEKDEKLNELKTESKHLKSDLDKNNELLKVEQTKCLRLQNENDQNTTAFEKIQKENLELKKKNDKLNELVQIGVQTYQEENRRVQDLEQRLAACKSLNGNDNGDNNNVCPTTNGN
ncbi:hypothetical protein DERF_006710 [Dermatophagoides farinae]|uniref:Uncharacterized protein n=1 Tax=Dermatophagoides farinae TaxID=6954 RepID=A0A922L2C1_DERFA|nr:hypothetical protein DERF_006710 [Dermatophagoides farinae]